MEVVDVSACEESVDRSPIICEFCGCAIDRPEKRCSALEDGRCQP